MKPQLSNKTFSKMMKKNIFLITWLDQFEYKYKFEKVVGYYIYIFNKCTILTQNSPILFCLYFIHATPHNLITHGPYTRPYYSAMMKLQGREKERKGKYPRCIIVKWEIQIAMALLSLQSATHYLK